MTEEITIQSISVNLLRMSAWYYKDPEKNLVVCQRYLDQSKTLGESLKNKTAKTYIKQLQHIIIPNNSEPHVHTAERFLTLGVLMQHPEKWTR